MRNRPLISHGMGTTIEGTPGALDDLTDVDAPSPTDGQALIWDSGAGEWVAGDAASALTVEDGTTSVSPVDTIVFDGATVTDDTGGQVTVEITGGGSSGPNLELDYVQITSDVTVSGTAETSAGSTLVVTGSAVTYDGATTVILEFFAPGWEPGLTSGNDVRLGLYEGSTFLGRLALTQMAVTGGNADNKPLRALYRFTPSAGSHTYAIRASRTSANGIIRAGAGGATNYVPAFIRITRANGGAALGTPPGARAVTNAVASIAHNTWTSIAYAGTDRFDTDAYHDNSTNNTRMTIPAGLGGRYLIGGTVGIAQDATGQRAARIYLNNATRIGGEVTMDATTAAVPSRMMSRRCTT